MSPLPPHDVNGAKWTKERIEEGRRLHDLLDVAIDTDDTELQQRHRLALLMWVGSAMQDGMFDLLASVDTTKGVLEERIRVLRIGLSRIASNNCADHREEAYNTLQRDATRVAKAQEAMFTGPRCKCGTSEPCGVYPCDCACHKVWDAAVCEHCGFMKGSYPCQGSHP